MKRLVDKLVVVVLAIHLASVAIPPVVYAITGSPRFDPSGDYHIVDSQLAKSIDYAYFDLEVRERRGKLVVWGHVYSRGMFFKIKTIALTPDKLHFVTQTVGDLKFTFMGQFTRTGRFADQFTGYGIVAIRGNLTRLRNGRTDAQASSKWLYYPGC